MINDDQDKVRAAYERVRNFYENNEVYGGEQWQIDNQVLGRAYLGLRQYTEHVQQMQVALGKAADQIDRLSRGLKTIQLTAADALRGEEHEQSET